MQGPDGLILARIGEADGEHVALSLGPHALVLKIDIDEEWAYKVSIPIIDLLDALAKETRRLGH